MSLSECPIPDAQGFCNPEGTGSNKVLILGESLGEAEAKDGLPFRPYAEAGSVLERAFHKLSYSRTQFVLYNVVPTRPPKNYLEGAPYESAAIHWGGPFVEKVIAEFKPRVILALGNIPLKAATGLHGKYLTNTYLRGYVLPGIWGVPVVPSLHPSYLRRKSMAHFSVLMHDMKLAVALAARQSKFWSPVLWRDFDAYPSLDSVPFPFDPSVPSTFITHPSESDAWAYYQHAKDDPNALICYDIETPRSTVTSEDETDELGETEILSVQFSTSVGEGIFLPFRDPFVEVVKAMLALPNQKAGHNVWRFDDPLLAAHGCPVMGQSHDLRWVWKAFQPDLMANFQFIDSFYGGARQGPYKHLHESHKEYYGIRDVADMSGIFGGSLG